MTGRQTGYQASLFYEFRLDDRIPKELLLRRINAAVGPILDSVRGQLKRYWRVSGLELDIVNRALLTQTRSRVCTTTIKTMMVCSLPFAPPLASIAGGAGTRPEHSIGEHRAKFRFYLSAKYPDGADGM